MSAKYKVAKDNFNIDDIEKYIKSVAKVVEGYDGKSITSNQPRFVTGGPFLHQDTDTSSEEESAEFENDNKELFDFLRSLDNEIMGLS